MIPTPEQAAARLRAILERGSVNLGGGADTERLMLMLTRSCELRCGYCLVQKREGAREMSRRDAKRALDLLMKSRRSKLELQLFGGEPTRSWAVLSWVVRYARLHPALAGRRMEIILTSNGVGLDASRIALLRRHRVTLLLSLDGDARAHKRFRQAHLLSDEAAYAAIDRAIDRLLASELSWFMNAVLPPAGAGEVMARYRWARSRGVARLQLNYAVGMRWRPRQEAAFLRGLVDVLRAHRADPGGLVLFNWRSACEPVMLSDDLIVDVDGAVYHDGAIFLERSFGALKGTYRRGHLDDLQDFDALRWSLATLYEVMLGTYAPGSLERQIIEENCRFGAAVDLAIGALRRPPADEPP